MELLPADDGLIADLPATLYETRKIAAQLVLP
jgi:hypothetical protein